MLSLGMGFRKETGSRVFLQAAALLLGVYRRSLIRRRKAPLKGRESVRTEHGVGPPTWIVNPVGLGFLRRGGFSTLFLRPAMSLDLVPCFFDSALGTGLAMGIGFFLELAVIRCEVFPPEEGV